MGFTVLIVIFDLISFFSEMCGDEDYQKFILSQITKKGESISSYSQFHQHFKSSFCANIHQKITKPN